MIKKTLEVLAKWIAASSLLLKIFTPFIYLSNHILANKKQRTVVPQELDSALIKHLGDPMVKNGPFKGMLYPSYQSVGSTIFPKILGSYEAELHPTIEKMIKANYNSIIDIGCAEGYYAVGFALRNPTSKIFAYDINETARELCRKMSMLNNTQESVTIETAFTPSSFQQIPPDKQTLIICDCEGYEMELFTDAALPFLKNTTLLIETHDFLNPDISIHLQNLLNDTHQIKWIQSVDDILKAKYYSFKELDGLTIAQRKELVKEARPTIMEWILATPKNE